MSNYILITSDTRSLCEHNGFALIQIHTITEVSNV